MANDLQTDDRLLALFHAYLDGELSADEAQELIEALKADRAAFRALARLERVAELAAQAPAPPLPSGFVERTLARLPARGPSAEPAERQSRWARARAIRVQISLPQLALGALALAVAVAAPWLWHARSAARHDGRVAVQFTFEAPGAHRVELAGDFNGWNPSSDALQRDAQGTYRLSLALPHGRYQYAFVVDGERWVPDPLAAEVVDDGFGGKNAVLNL